jgi:hypothetical protein
MSGRDWVSVAQYSDPLSAGVVSKRLSDEGVPNRIWIPPRSGGECYIWVPPESANAAKQILAEPAVPEEELTALALKDPPPGDFEIPESKQPTLESKPVGPIIPSSGTPLGCLIAVLFIGLLVALSAYIPRIRSYEVARQRSPDGGANAVLIEVPHDAAGAHSYKVCMQMGANTQTTAGYCSREVAYLAGVNTDGNSRPVTLVWTAPSQLEIRYTNASSVHIYQPIVVWGSRYPPASRVGANAAIFVRAVQTSGAAPRVQR